MIGANTCQAQNLQAVIFDCDGVLVDTEPLHYAAFQEVLVPLGLGHDYARYLKHFVGFDDRDAFVHAFSETGRQLSADSLVRLIQAKSAALARLIGQGTPSFPGVVELVKELKDRGIPLAVASGALRHEVEAFLSSLGLQGIFRVIAGADDVEKSKPAPQTYLLALERLRDFYGPIDARNCIAIEDTPAGIQSAKTAGMRVVGITNSFPASDLAGADKVIGSLSDLNFQAMVRLLETRRQEQR
ncbi:MAG: HAD family hydrolase [Syntrophobacteraceae bacterium]